MNRTNGLPVVAVEVVVRVVAARIEVEVSRDVVVRVRNGRPVVAARTGIAERSPVAAAGAGEKDTVSRIIPSATDNIAVHAVLRRPSPIAVVVEVANFLICRHPPIAAPMSMRRIMLWSKHSLRCYPAFTLQG